MKQKRLYRTIDAAASGNFSSESDMLISVLNQIILLEDIGIKGARIWMLDPERKGYKLLFQTGLVEKISKSFFLNIADDSIYENIANERTILSSERNQVLLKKGILKYSASGVGNKIKIEGKYYYEYLLALNSDNINEELRYTLNIIATVLTSQLQHRRLAESQKHLKADIDRARELQKSILPEHEYKFHNYELFGLTLPAENVGGDFFDYLRIGDDEERLGITVGDAASKGLAAAAEAMYISGAVRMAASFQIKISPFMKKLNELVHKIFSEAKFTTLFYCEISTDKNGLCLYASAGHNPPIFIKAKSKKIFMLSSTGPLLGPAPHAKYETENINFDVNDVLVIYTDGITEGVNSEDECYEEDRLKAIIKKTMHLSPKEIALKIVNDNLNFCRNGNYNDDRTVVVIKKIK